MVVVDHFIINEEKNEKELEREREWESTFESRIMVKQKSIQKNQNKQKKSYYNDHQFRGMEWNRQNNNNEKKVKVKRMPRWVNRQTNEQIDDQNFRLFYSFIHSQASDS